MSASSPKADIASSYGASISGGYHVSSNNGFSPLVGEARRRNSPRPRGADKACRSISRKDRGVAHGGCEHRLDLRRLFCAAVTGRLDHARRPFRQTPSPTIRPPRSFHSGPQCSFARTDLPALLADCLGRSVAAIFSSWLASRWSKFASNMRFRLRAYPITVSTSGRALGRAAIPAAPTGRTRDRTRPMLQAVRKFLPSETMSGLQPTQRTGGM